MKDQLSALNPGLFRELVNIFSLAEHAEEVIQEMQQTHPEHKDLIYGSFRYLVPTEPLKNKAPRLYKKHCQEMITRLIKGENLSPASDAEMVGFLSDLSLKAPLNTDPRYVFQLLFTRLFPGSDIEMIGCYETYKGAGDEIVYKLRKKLSDNRSLEEEKGKKKGKVKTKINHKEITP